MIIATVRSLRESFPIITQWIEAGESVEIRRSKKPSTRLSPSPPKNSDVVEMPDFLARLRDRFPDEMATEGLVSIVDYDRGDR